MSDDAHPFAGKVLAELPEVKAMVVIHRPDWRRIVAAITGNPSATRCDACRATGAFHCQDVWYGNCNGMRDYTADEVLAALDARVAAAVRKARDQALEDAAIEVVKPSCMAPSEAHAAAEIIRAMKGVKAALADHGPTAPGQIDG